MRDATVAIEDQRFYKHGGVDYEGIVRAAIKNLERARRLQGGSTITMQLVRNLYMPRPARSNSSARSARRSSPRSSRRSTRRSGSSRLPQRRAVRDRRRPDRDRRRGRGADLLRQAARELTLPEAAMLAGLPQAPSQYNPFHNPRAARKRRNEVLQRDGRRRLHHPGRRPTSARRAAGRATQRRLHAAPRAATSSTTSRSELIRRYGAGVVQQGGLKVYTTINPKMPGPRAPGDQAHVATRASPSAGARRDRPANGHILAMASIGTYGRPTSTSPPRRHRQPGSTFKTIVLMTAVREGDRPRHDLLRLQAAEPDGCRPTPTGTSRPTATPTPAR